jgi:Asp-tRNA(Asn)/Glu-tRNA(Gln) amidotransferase A subunit family amidase
MAAHFKADKDAAVVAFLKSEGAIPMVRGNVPQFVYAGHTENRIFGCALNPYDKTRTCAGSSGGDGALVSAKCVPFAIGTDIGGSIRAPAACLGIIGFKPTA